MDCCLAPVSSSSSLVVVVLSIGGGMEKGNGEGAI